MRLLLCLIACLGLGLSAQAQTQQQQDPLAALQALSLEELSTEVADPNWAYASTEEKFVYYVDFANIHVDLAEVSIKDAKGEILFKDSVLDLPSDTIYELDFKTYGEGEYTIELLTFAGHVRQPVQIR